jgi:hypothetical protein
MRLMNNQTMEGYSLIIIAEIYLNHWMKVNTIIRWFCIGVVDLPIWLLDVI